MQSLLAHAAAGRRQFARLLVAWFRKSMRPLPWRGDYAPYAVWISEVMLQQTQMERGVQYFRRWMERFPSIAHVAEATEEEILKAWEGLGYYARARKLHAAAKCVMTEHGGVFPEDIQAIRALPGIGPYTAGAIASLAFNQPLAAVDANVTRVFARLLDIDAHIGRSGVADYIRRHVELAMPRSNAREYNQALMELGALVCGKTPRCGICPVAGFCEAKRLGTALSRPVTGKKTVYAHLEMATGIVARQGRTLIQKRLPYGVWAGLWEFPGGCLEEGETPEACVVREFWEETELSVRVEKKIAVLRHAYTTCRVTMHAYFCSMEDSAHMPILHSAAEFLWVTPAELARFTFPAGHRKLLEFLDKEKWHSARTYGLEKMDT